MYICSAVVARLLELAYGTANARMQVWNGSICALGAVGEPAIIVTLMMMSSEHKRFLYYMHGMYLLCWTLTVSPNLISISGPSLLCHGVVFIIITLKNYCVYMLKCYDHDTHRMAGAWSVGFGYGRDSEQLIWSIETCTFHFNASYYHLIDEVTLNDTRHDHMVFLTKLTDLCVMTAGLQKLAFNDLHSFDMTESYRYHTMLHWISKPCRDHSVRAQTIRACVVL